MKKILIIFFFFALRGFYAQVFDPINPDEELLKRMVIEKINAKRAKRKAAAIVVNDALQKTADTYVEKYRYTKFENNTVNKIRIKKKVKKFAQINGYKNAFIDFHIVSVGGMNYSGNKFYYDKEDSETSTHLFMGDKPSKKEKEEPSFKLIPMKTITYEELATIIARNFIRDDGYFGSLNNGYDKFGFALAVDKNTVLKRKIPKLKVILIMGGKRITW